MAPPNNRSFVKKTKAGRVMKVVREHYLRDDIYVGSELAAPEFRGPDPSSWKLAKDASAYVVVDTNVALHQMDLLAHACVTDVVVPSVVLEECRARSRPSYERLRALCQDPAKRFFVFANEHHRDTYVKAEPGESPNDRNDRAIRVVCAFYRRAVPEMRVVLLTNDRGNLRKARDEGVDAVSCREFAKRAASRDPTSEAAGLADLVAPSALDEDELDLEDGAERLQERLPKRAKKERDEDEKRKTPKNEGPGAPFVSFAEHLSPAAVAAGLAGGSLHQGTLRTSRHSPWEGSIACDALGCDILLSGRGALNRAMDGDVVAVSLLPESEWRAPKNVLPGAGADAESAEPVDVSLAPRVADEQEDAAVTHLQKTPTGVVVSVTKRAWRERGYASSLDVGPGASGAAGRRAARTRPAGRRACFACPWTGAYPRSASRRGRRPRSRTRGWWWP